jgi:flagellar biosynthesis component FlhA
LAQTKAIAAPALWKGFGGINLTNASDLGVPIAVLAIVIALIAPMPWFLLDILLVTDIMMSVIVMMVAM